MQETSISVLLFCAVVVLFWCSRTERLINRNSDHNAKVESRLHTLERRITALERGHTIENGIETCRNNKCGICNR